VLSTGAGRCGGGTVGVTGAGDLAFGVNSTRFLSGVAMSMAASGGLVTDGGGGGGWDGTRLGTRGSGGRSSGGAAAAASSVAAGLTAARSIFGTEDARTGVAGV
jgi:hypothetical protein